MSTDPFGKEAHDRHHPTHSGLDGHECNGGWDGLYICRDCDEYEHCECETEVDSETLNKAVAILNSKALCISDSGIEFHDVSPEVYAEMKRRTQRSFEYWQRARKAERAAKFLYRLAQEGGTIVSSASCSQAEIAAAESCGRMHVNENGCGFVLRPGASI